MPPIFYKLTHKAIGIWTKVRRPLTLGVKAAVRDEAGSILLVRHSYVDGWHLPGGGVEKNETAAEAVIREVREELGLVAKGEPQLHAVYFAPHRGKSDHILIFNVEVESLELSPNWEIAEVGFFAADELPEGTGAPTRNRVAELCHGKTPPANWFD